MPSALVSGSLAYDVIYKFNGVFQDKLILSEKRNLSLAFNVAEKTIHFGGCAGNIVYNGRLLGEDFLLLGIAGGRDFADYQNWLKKNKIDCSHVILEPEEFTSQAAVVNDNCGQQLTFFHEGAASKAKNHRNRIIEEIQNSGAKIAIVSPNSKDFVESSIEGCVKADISFIFDPGQIIPLFSADELRQILSKAKGMILNEYELEFIQKQSGMPFDEIKKLCGLIVETLGEKGSRIYFGSEVIDIPTRKIESSADPTGCGDAYRAGFLSGVKDNFPNLNRETLTKAAEKGTQLALACLGKIGTQNHGCFF